MEGNYGECSERGTLGASGRNAAFFPFKHGGGTPVLEPVAAHLGVKVLDDCFGSEANAIIVLLHLIGFLGSMVF